MLVTPLDAEFPPALVVYVDEAGNNEGDPEPDVFAPYPPLEIALAYPTPVLDNIR
jgi:hypothetical protein